MQKMDEAQTAKLLKKYRVPTPRQFVAKNERQAAEYAKKIGYPLVLKIFSPDVIHKTDFRAVLVGLQNEKEVLHGFREIIRNVKKKMPGAKINGVIVQETAIGHEVIIGSKQDPQFGPVIMFGLGGIFVEVFKDVTFRIIPIERKDAQQMIAEIKGAKILHGVRGHRPVNFRALEDCLLAVSRMMWANRKIMELDLNPVFVNEKGVKAVDARILV